MYIHTSSFMFYVSLSFESHKSSSLAGNLQLTDAAAAHNVSAVMQIGSNIVIPQPTSQQEVLVPPQQQVLVPPQQQVLVPPQQQVLVQPQQISTQQHKQISAKQQQTTPNESQPVSASAPAALSTQSNTEKTTSSISYGAATDASGQLIASAPDPTPSKQYCNMSLEQTTQMLFGIQESTPSTRVGQSKFKAGKYFTPQASTVGRRRWESYRSDDISYANDSVIFGLVNEADVLCFIPSTADSRYLQLHCTSLVTSLSLTPVYCISFKIS